MAYRNYHKRKITDRDLHPETQMMSYGYDPFVSEGSVKPSRFPDVDVRVSHCRGRRRVLRYRFRQQAFAGG